MAKIILDSDYIEWKLEIEFSADSNLDDWKDVLKILTTYMTYPNTDFLDRDD